MFGQVQTEAELAVSVDENTEFSTCPLNHGSDAGAFHKEPVIASLPGSAAIIERTRTILHTRQPDGTYLTTVVAL